MKVSLFFILTFMMCQSVFANNEDPEIALLEFLGSFSTDDEQWFDPTLLVDIEIIDEKSEKGQNDE